MAWAVQIVTCKDTRYDANVAAPMLHVENSSVVIPLIAWGMLPTSFLLRTPDGVCNAGEGRFKL